MGNRPSAEKRHHQPTSDTRHELLSTGSGHGPEVCKSCWFERKGLVMCSNHYLCMDCLSLLISVSERCPICKLPLPQKLHLKTPPTAPPLEPPPYAP
ncbi:Z protein [Kitale virus]|uniref:Z protein n=1 Tax=Kitale virus TaxID=2847814 RepID=A0A6B9KPY2_9VIRU|nr:Z protein [Kitale virus]QHB13140.1 Z protein [Kitale virus]